MIAIPSLIMPTASAKCVIAFLEGKYRPTDPAALVYLQFIHQDLDALEVAFPQDCDDEKMDMDVIVTDNGISVISSIFKEELREVPCTEEVRARLGFLFDLLMSRLVA